MKETKTKHNSKKCPECNSKTIENKEFGYRYCIGWPWCSGKIKIKDIS